MPRAVSAMCARPTDASLALGFKEVLYTVFCKSCRVWSVCVNETIAQSLNSLRMPAGNPCVYHLWSGYL